MSLATDYVSRLYEIYENHGIYVGTANGERTLDIAGKFYEYEKRYGRPDPYTDAARDYEFLASCYRKKWDMSKSRAGDCSGIIIGILRDMGLIGPTEDYNATTLQRSFSTPIPLDQIQPGDWLFDKSSEASHIGTYIGNGETIDSRGRDLGVVRQYLDSYAWKAAGRPIWFTEIPPLTRNLYYKQDDMMRGDDVRQCQTQLTKKGFTEVGTIDGVFGSKTDSAVRHFQAANSLQIDGIVGPKTWDKLFTI